MDEDVSSHEALLELVKSNLLIVGVFCVGIIFIIVGLVQIFSKKTPEISFESGTQEVKAVSVQKIMVDVEGAVMRPGVYSLPDGSRVQDALIAAGGASGNADHAFIAKTLNLAQKLTDGMKLYIPAEGEITTTQVSVGLISGSEKAQTGVVSINSATLSELDTLSGVGPVTAQKIIDNRPYGDVAELVSKKVVGQSVFEKIKTSISL
jgi:competence protein ComEA